MVTALLVAHLTNSQAASLCGALALMDRPHEQTLYGSNPLGPEGNGATPVLPATRDLLGSSRLL